MIQAICINPVQAHQAMMKLIWPALKVATAAGQRMVLSIKPETRSLKENALLHALLTHISQQKEWAGQKRDTETWKRLITAACVSSNQSVNPWRMC